MKLIPVIEIGFSNQDVKAPERGPYWKYPDEWDQYKRESYQKAGFKDPLVPIDLGASLFEVELISDANLRSIILDHTSDLRKGKYDREQACPLFGGYVLEVAGERRIYPQCCGDLGDIQFWRNIAAGQQSYYEGHPGPVVTFEDDKIIFDLTMEEFGEAFVPVPAIEVFSIKKSDLLQALQETEVILERLAERIRNINETDDLNLERIEDLLIWENTNYQ